MALFPSTSIASAAGGYDIDNSCRFDRASSASLLSSAYLISEANTLSFWFKRSNLGYSNCYLFQGNDMYATITSGDKIELGRSGCDGITNRVFRDISAWYHIHFEATSSNTKIYINGVLDVTLTCVNSYSSGAMRIGANIGGTNSFDGYIAELHLVDGTTLTPSSFGEVDADYGHWKPKKYSGTHGTNGYYLDFANSGSLGNDAAGSNNFTPSNLAVHDQMPDSPTNNFSVISNIDGAKDSYDVFAEGNLSFKNTANALMSMRRSTFAMEYGKWYWEVYRKDSPGEQGVNIGIMPTPSGNNNSTDIGSPATSSAFGLNKGIGFKGNSATHGGSDNTVNGTVPTQAQGDIIQFAYDAATGYFWVGFNGTWRNSGNPAAGTNPWAEVSATNLANITYAPAWNSWNNVHWIANFGQDGTFAGNVTAGGNADDEDYGNFKYDVPAGFLVLCSKNLSEPAVKPGEHFNEIIYDDGAGAKTGIGFAPELIWLKARDNAGHNHRMCDIIQGTGKALQPNDGAGQVTEATGLTAFGADGFTVGSNAAYSDTTGTGMVAWCWKLGGTASSNTNGSITSSVSANAVAGVSVGTWAGSGANATIGHGLSKAPEFVVVHAYDSPDSWPTGSIQVIASMDFTDYLRRDSTAALAACTTCWNNTAPTATVINLGTSDATNKSGVTWRFEAYHSVDGYSRVGSYRGNSNVDGSFIYTGFRPSCIIQKCINTTESWHIYDTDRDPYNPTNKRLQPNASTVEQTGTWSHVDFLSNGFKPRMNDQVWNGAFYYIYIAFAETPFKYTTAF